MSLAHVRHYVKGHKALNTIGLRPFSRRPKWVKAILAYDQRLTRLSMHDNEQSVIRLGVSPWGWVNFCDIPELRKCASVFSQVIFINKIMA